MPREIVFDKDQALQKAIKVFWSKGYHATSMEHLSEATGLNRSSIYNTFGNKLSLYQLALKTYQRKANSEMQGLLLKASNSEEAIQLLFDALIKDILQDDEGKGCFNMNCKSEMARSQTAIKEWLEATQEHALDFYTQLVADGQKEGLINTFETAKSYAAYLYSAYQGIRMTGLLLKDENVLKGIANNTLARLKP